MMNGAFLNQLSQAYTVSTPRRQNVLCQNGRAPKRPAPIRSRQNVPSKVAYLLPVSILINLYHTLIHPYLAYCNVCWASTYQASLDRLIKLQKKAIRVITKSAFAAHTSPLFHQLKIFNLDQIRQLQTGIFMYLANHNLLPAIFQNYFINIKDIHSFFHSDHFYSASSNPLLRRGAPDTARILCRSFTPTRHNDHS